MKRRHFQLLFLLASSLFLAGCASRYGSREIARFTRNDIESHIIDGQTTKEEVLGMFGPNFYITLDDAQRESWHYKYVMKNGQETRFVNQLVVLFNENNIVHQHRFYSTEDKNGSIVAQ